jgi:hypothetical protein
MDKSCAKCGKQLQPDQSVCDKCGAPWTPTAETASAAASNPVNAAPPPVVTRAAAPAQTSRSGTSRALLIIAIAVFLLGIGWLSLRHRAAGRSSVGLSAASFSSSGHTVTTSTASHATPAATAAATEAAANSKPCSLVTRAEMETILGSKIVKMNTNEQTCYYFTDDETSAEVDTTWTGGKDAMAQAKGFNKAPGLFEPVAGIGNEAYFQAAGVLHVLKADTYVVVNSRVYPNVLETESAIARKAIEKVK